MDNKIPAKSGLHKTALAIAIALSIAIFGCALDAPPKIVPLDVDMVLPPVGTEGVDPDRLNAFMSEIRARNEGVEDEEDWIRRSYKGLMVRRLTNVSTSEYATFNKYLDNGTVYILVHPSFFSFFHYPKKLTESTEDSPSKYNVVERLLKIKPQNPQFALLQAQERRMRDFIEYKATEKKLLVIVIPKNYQKYSGYTYRKGVDEYMRYLNEVTNMSESVLFVESKSPNRGYLTDDDAMRLMEFILSIKAKRVLVGGGYIGRCLEDFYVLLTKEYGKEDIYIVPELSDISPREIDDNIARTILKTNGLIDEDMATKIMANDLYKIQEGIPSIMNLPKVEKNQTEGKP